MRKKNKPKQQRMCALVLSLWVEQTQWPGIKEVGEEVKIGVLNCETKWSQRWRGYGEIRRFSFAGLSNVKYPFSAQCYKAFLVRNLQTFVVS
jgi:hypothetical protein